MMEVSVKIFEGAPKVRLGELITVDEEINRKGCDFPFFGVNKDKEFMPTVASTDGLNPKKYKIIRKDKFVFSGMQTGRDGCIRFAIYPFEKPALISPAYTTLSIKNFEKVLPEYISIYFLSSERDRLGAFYSDASVRANLELYRFLQIEIPLPSIKVQREYVAAYKSLQQLAEQNEAMIEPLQTACNAFLLNIKAKYNIDSLGRHIVRCDERNGDKYNLNALKGVSIEKVFIPTKAVMDGVSLKTYKIIKPHWFCFVPITSRNGEKITLALNVSNETYISSSAYEVFKVVDETLLLPEYLFLFFRRPEFDRLARFNSWGSAREAFSYQDMERIEIPLPPIEVQRSIVALYRCAEEARSIAKEAREQLKKLAPAMVQRAANTPVEV